jgi:uncharacterized protein (TIGR01777 family)
MTAPVVVVSGASGLIGSALTPLLEREGFHVRRLVRRRPVSKDEIEWNPLARFVDREALDGAEAVVNLAGENIGHRWTTARRRRIRDSRIAGTDTIAHAIARAAQPPRTLINASAVGIYGDRGDDVLTESAVPGKGFLADVSREWERATDPAQARGTRVVLLRSGVVLARHAGALARLLLPFRLGLGGRLGSGRQWMSWISLEDHVRAVVHTLATPALEGPVNVVAPNPVTNAEFTAAVGRAVHRWTVFPVPGIALRLVFGQMATETLLASQRAIPEQLVKFGFVHHAPTIDGALARTLDRSPATAAVTP